MSLICQSEASSERSCECRSVVTESVGLCISDEPRLKCSRQVLLHSESHFLASLLQYPEENQDFKIREILKSALLLFSYSRVSKTLWPHRLWPARPLCSQARILEWVAVSLGRLEKYFRKMKVLFRPESYRQIEGRTEVLMGKGFLFFRGLGPCQRGPVMWNLDCWESGEVQGKIYLARSQKHL